MRPECGAEMQVIATIEDPGELKQILRHLIKIGLFPPGLFPDRLKPTGVPGFHSISRIAFFAVLWSSLAPSDRFAVARRIRLSHN